ncbi:hypothetical protein K504DRAFT_415392 [Pleomassaria siparia CBS 279.74]|uniref:Uncharacterized protein n=1 Tax=Pleomassaria siparia CBS 279.74 TaxID=1314801 RepID=A0A6G1JXP5_9PLEO|nr:hypothetical protein K504DRAFT_415392 [Pleomassaria siparia CBS 279.74]
MASSNLHLDPVSHNSSMSRDVPLVEFTTARGVRSKRLTKHGQPAEALPTEFLAAVSQDVNGDYGSIYSRKVEGTIQDHDVWYSFKVKMVEPSRSGYYWQQISAFIRYSTIIGSTFVLCVDCPASIQNHLRAKMVPSLASVSDWHVMFLEVMMEHYDKSVWQLRDCVRQVECMRGSEQTFQPDFIHLHELARHVIHSNETLDVAIDTIRSIRDHQEIIGEDPQVQNRTSALEKHLKRINRRSQSLHERLQNEINLAFNLVAQRDSRTMVQIGDQARKDSKTMKAVAVVGLIYLPGTFVSGLFGMNFFDFKTDSEQQMWVVSDKMWVYWAVSVPLTLLTVLVWIVAFHGRGAKKAIQAQWSRSHEQYPHGKKNGY